MPDGSDIPVLCENLELASKRLHELSEKLSDAKKLQKFAAGTEKGLVAKYVVKHLKEGSKLALAEKLALADPAYLQERETMIEAWALAQKILDEHAQASTSWETARSLLSMAKAAFPAAYSYTKNFEG